MNKKFLNITLFLIGVLLLFQPPSDPDFGWHYKYGEYIFQNHQILRQNTFSYTFTNYSWANSYWMAELALYVLFTSTGAIGMSLILSVVMSALVVRLLNNTNAAVFGKSLAAILFFLICRMNITVRPFYFSTLFLLILIYILIHKRSWQFLLPPMFMVWANTHADFTIGLFIYAIFTAFVLFPLLRNYRRPRTLLSLTIFPILSVLATLINPYGINLWATLLKETHYFQFSHISEWLPIGSSQTFVWFFTIFMLSLIFSSAFLAYIRAGKLYGVWYVMVCAFFFLASLRSVYFVRILVTVALISIPVFWDFIMSFLIPPLTKRLKFSGKFFYGIFLVLVLISLNVFLMNVIYASDIGKWADVNKYPYHAVEYLKKSKPVGNILNVYDWGGYLIWQLPEHKVFIDGRMTSWRESGKSVFEDYIAITQHPKKNEALLNEYINKYNIGTVLDRRDSVLVKYLLATGDWEKLQEDKIYSLIRKKSNRH